MVYKSAQRKGAAKPAQAFVGRKQIVPLLLKPVGRNGFEPVLGIAGPREFVVPVRIVGLDEFALFGGILDPGEFTVVVAVVAVGGRGGRDSCHRIWWSQGNNRNHGMR